MKAIRKLLPVLTAGLVTAAVALPATAQASPIRECGNWVDTNGQPGTWHWSYRYSLSYSPVRNLTTRNVSCSNARPFSVRIGAGWGSLHGFACKWRYWNHRSQADVRCTRGNQVIHWQGATS